MTIKTFTSASANKFLRSMEDDKAHLLALETETCTYVLSQEEEGEPPIYSYDETRARIEKIDEQVRKVRHALHRFNMQTTLPESSMTVDEALIAMAQMSAVRNRLNKLRTILPKQRENSSFGMRVAEYRYANFDVEQAQADYLVLTDAINDLQLKIDLCNQTLTFDVEL